MSKGEWYSFAMGCLFGASVFLMWLLPPEPKVCPVVEGQKVVTTYNVNDGHYCVYEKSSPMRAKRSVKL